MSDDRFGDLGAGRHGDEREQRDRRTESLEDLGIDKDRSAAEQLAELDESDPEPRPPGSGPPPPRRTGGRYTWVVGVVALIAIVVAGVNSVPNAGRGSEGPPAGEVMPAFAAPSALGDREGDANVKQDADDRGAGNETPACEVTGSGIVNICELRRDRPVVVSFVVPGAGDCEREVDRLDRLQREFPQVAFVAVVSGRGKDRVADLAREHGWRLPVAVDEDLAVFNAYRVALCATTVFARRGGVVRETKVKSQELSDAELRASIAAVSR